jgi:hypothetical protein
MKKLNVLLLLLGLFVLSGCSVITAIFKAGVAVGVIAIIVVLVIIIWIISLFRK